ncbi:MAG: hypothetical protein KAS32_08135 [Candidatus Peribacteraceae bacterium]|nr:hypothetical protein [Candidatus Peribacteraceae bacterium]
MSKVYDVLNTAKKSFDLVIPLYIHQKIKYGVNVPLAREIESFLEKVEGNIEIKNLHKIYEKGTSIGILSSGKDELGLVLTKKYKDSECREKDYSILGKNNKLTPLCRIKNCDMGRYSVVWIPNNEKGILMMSSKADHVSNLESLKKIMKMV